MTQRRIPVAGEHDAQTSVPGRKPGYVLVFAKLPRGNLEEALRNVLYLKLGWRSLQDRTAEPLSSVEGACFSKSGERIRQTGIATDESTRLVRLVADHPSGPAGRAGGGERCQAAIRQLDRILRVRKRENECHGNSGEAT